jgi:hypothetical protein
MAGTVIDLGLFLVAAFVAALITGVEGFTFGLIASAAWLHRRWITRVLAMRPTYTAQEFPK